MTAPARSVFAEPLAQAREALHCECGKQRHHDEALAALDLIERKAGEMEAENERLRETLARVRPDIDQETGYGRQEAI